MTDTATFELSPQQRHLWTLHPTSAAFRAQAAVLVPDTVTTEALRAALDVLVDRHEVLRTTYVQPAGMRLGVQVVHDELAPSWRVTDDPLAATLTAERLAPIDLGVESPVRAVLVAGGTTAALVVTLPSLAADTTAAVDLARAVITLAAGDDEADDPLQYADYAAYQSELLARGDDAARDRWAARAAAYPIEVPFQRAVPTAVDVAFVDVEVPVAPATLDAVDALAATLGVDPSLIAQAAWHALLARLSAESEIGVATLDPCRHVDDLDGALGLISRYVAVCTHLEADLTATELVRALQAAHDEAVADLDQWEWPDATATDRTQLAFSAVPSGPDLLAASARIDRFALELVWGAAPSRAALVADAAAFAEGVVARTARLYARLLAELAAAPDAPVSRLAMLDDDERATVLEAFNRTEAAWPANRTVIDLFAERAASHPDRAAVASGADQLTYGELDRLANRIAHVLRAHGTTTGGAVGLCMDRSPLMLAGLLGIMKAGAAYVPVNYEHPEARLAHQLTETGATVVLAVPDTRANLPTGTTVVDLVADRAQIDAQPTTAPAGGAGPADVAYVLYTSGSTGLPKGVAVTHSNLANYATAISRRFGAPSIEPGWVWGVVTAISTDLGNTCVFPPLVSGGCVNLVPPDIAMDPFAFAGYCRQWPLDVLKVTPSHLTALLVAGAARVLPREVLITGGEASGWAMDAQVQAAGTCRIVNHYGPTETTIGSCTFDVPADPGPWQPATVPIGAPIANTVAYVVDRHDEPQPIGVAGELLIGGAGVAVGYIGQPEQTAERFVTDPFRGAPHRVYRTGDLARWLPDGTLEFLGRIDDQVKIRGYRVEPREIEHVVRQHSRVRQVAVVAREDTPGDRRLVAYVVADATIPTEELRSLVSASLPDHMAPSAYVFLGSLPFTASGKLDRRALPAPDPTAATDDRPRLAPRNPTEEQIAAWWAEVLGVDLVGVDEDFFELGGHSLLAAQVVARVRAGFGVELPLHVLFTAPTVELMAQEVEALQLASVTDDDVAALLNELEGMSDEEATRLLGEA